MLVRRARRAVARRIRLRGVVAGGVRRRPGTRDARVVRYAFIRRAQSRRTRRIAAVHRIARGARRSRRTRDARAARHALVRRARRHHRSSQRDRLSRHRALPGGVPGRNIHARHAREIRGRRPRELLRSRSARVRVLLRRPAARLRGESRNGGRRPRARVRERRGRQTGERDRYRIVRPVRRRARGHERPDARRRAHYPRFRHDVDAGHLPVAADLVRRRARRDGERRKEREKPPRRRRARAATRRRAHADASVAR